MLTSRLRQSHATHLCYYLCGVVVNHDTGEGGEGLRLEEWAELKLGRPTAGAGPFLVFSFSSSSGREPLPKPQGYFLRAFKNTVGLHMANSS